MDYVSLHARAKVNLAIDVLGCLPQGYHEVRGVMQSVALADSVLIKKIHKENYQGSARLKVVSNLDYLPSDDRNIAYKAARLLIDRFDIQTGVFINLAKHIPVSAGLGGGSADCAAVLIGMRKLFNLPLTWGEMSDLGAGLGADVPFCIMRGTALAEGVGERLTRLKPMPGAWIVLAKPPVAVSTADVFKAFDASETPLGALRPNIDRLLGYIAKGDLPGACSQMCNALEPVTAAMHPIVPKLKEFLLSRGALGALMSGSGPTVFGVFAKIGEAVSARDSLRNYFPAVKDVLLTRTFTVY